MTKSVMTDDNAIKDDDIAIVVAIISTLEVNDTTPLEEKSKFIVCDGWITEVIGLNTFTEVSAIDSVISTEVSN